LKRGNSADYLRARLANEAPDVLKAFATWGSWKDLQATWAEVVAGKLTEPEAKERIRLGKHGGDRKSDHYQGDNVTLMERGNSNAYTLARLARDHPDIAKRIRSGAISANRGAIEAGYRKKPTPTLRPKEPPRGTSHTGGERVVPRGSRTSQVCSDRGERTRRQRARAKRVNTSGKTLAP
jgi:hypothetical protein